MPSKNTSSKKLTTRNTKAEILTAYNDLINQEKELRAQIKQAQSSSTPTLLPVVTASVSHAPEAKTAVAAASQDPSEAAPKATPIPSSLAFTTMGDILQGLEHLQIGFGGAISGLSEQLTQEATQLQSLQEDVDQEIDQLEALHDLSADDTDLDALIEQYNHDFKAFQEALETQKEQWERSLTDAETTWAKEQADYHHTRQTEQAAQHKAQARDGEDYDYRIALERQLAQEEFEQEEKRLHQELAEAHRLQQKAWETREQEIAARETAFEELKAKAEALPGEREDAVKRAKEEGKGIAQQQAKVRADLAAKEREGQRHAYELRLQSLNETLHHQENRIQTLSTQLSDALKQVQDLAVKAIDGAANASSLQAMKEIALEQAKMPNKGK